jgi:hypothetical protein
VPDRHDTRLARLLHAKGRVPLAELLRHLELVKAERARNPHVNLAGVLVGAGLLSGEEVEGWVTELGRAPEPRPSPQPLTRWEPGGRVGDYVLGERLGSGGMGVVFRARHIVSGREVALKGVPCHGDEAALARFQREAAAQATVDAHPNVIRIHDAGLAGSSGYLAMELASGGDLAELLARRGTLPETEAARIVAQLARGMAHVHARGILHRDLKPANVLFGADGTPKLVDFGLARMTDESRITLTGELVGTPAYMAPEQALGLHEDIDARTDVYGLGVLLYELLTGEIPHQAAGMVEVLVQVINDEPPRPLGAGAGRGWPAIDPRAAEGRGPGDPGGHCRPGVRGRLPGAGRLRVVGDHPTGGGRHRQRLARARDDPRRASWLHGRLAAGRPAAGRISRALGAGRRGG